MSTLESTFTREELETLIEAMGDWEMLGNQEWHFAQMLKSAPMPPEDSEGYEVFHHIKEHFHNREKEINASRAIRQEKAVFLKAKLMLARRDVDIKGLFDFATTTSSKTHTASQDTQTPVKTPITESKLELAEHFIRDLGVWNHYEKFLAEKAG